MRISFIGYGNMAKAITRKLTQFPEYTLSAAAPSLNPGTNKDTIYTHFDNKIVVKEADIVILAVKPAQMNAVLTEIASFVPSTCLLISVAAGLDLAWLAQRCSNKQAIVRSMPNTPAAQGLGATPLIANRWVGESQKKSAFAIFSAIGIVTWANNEMELDSYTALSGSGPAYVFSFLEAMINAAVKLGIDPDKAKAFTLQTLKGALGLAESSDLSLSELRTKVTSPGGTTAAALNLLHEPLNKLMLSAMLAAKHRAHELGQLY